MAHLISFTTDRFDVSRERPHPINPIAGQSVLLWLREELLRAHYRVTEPDTEDWGWYVDVQAADASYLVGASAETAATASPVEWIIQVHKHRTLKDRLLGRNRLTADDPLFAFIETLVHGADQLEQVSVTRNA